MKGNRSTLALVFLIAGITLYPLGMHLSRLASERDTYSIRDTNPWHFDFFHSFVVSLRVIVPAALTIVGCIYCVQVLLATCRSEGVRALFRVRAIHLWVGSALLAYLLLVYILCTWVLHF